MSGDVFVFAAATRDVPWHEAEACGWFNCPEAGGWLRQVTEEEVRYPGGREQAIERMAQRGLGLPYTALKELLAAAEGRET